MPGLISDATRIWETNIYWPLYAQCGIWDPKGKGVDIWECIRPRMYYLPLAFFHEAYDAASLDESTQGTQVS